MNLSGYHERPANARHGVIFHASYAGAAKPVHQAGWNDPRDTSLGRSAKPGIKLFDPHAVGFPNDSLNENQIRSN